MAKEQTKKSKLAKTLSIIVDIFFIPVIVLALVCVIIMFTAKANNKVPSIFGKSIVTVRSESMEDKFSVGDVLLIEKVEDLKDIKVGDDIAFYAPRNTPFVEIVNGEKKSLIIIHRVMRIIYPTDANGQRHRYFVCAGINGFSMDVSMFERVTEGSQGDYFLNEQTNKCELAVTPAQKANAEYVCRLFDPQLKNPQDPTVEEIESTTTVSMQYVIGDDDTTKDGNYDYVVGAFSRKLSPIIGGFINFSATSLGIIILVIVPTLILIGFIVISMVKEVKKAKEEDSEENITIQQNMEYIKTANALSEADKAKEEAEQAKDEDVSADDKAKKEVNDELAKGASASSIIASGANAPKKAPVKKAPASKSKPENAQNEISANDGIAQAKPKKIPTKKVADDNKVAESAQSGAPKKMPVKRNPATTAKANIKKIPRSRT